MRRNAIVGQSGGPTAAINATLAGVIKGCLENEAIDKVYGMRHGIDGILNDNVTELNPIFTDSDNLNRLLRRPSVHAERSCLRSGMMMPCIKICLLSSISTISAISFISAETIPWIPWIN